MSRTHVSLQSLLESMFDEAELRGFLRRFTDDPGWLRDLRGPPIRLSELVAEAIELLGRHGLLGPAFFAELGVVRPHRREEIERIAGELLSRPSGLDGEAPERPAAPPLADAVRELVAYFEDRAAGALKALKRLQRSSATRAFITDFCDLHARHLESLRSGQLLRAHIALRAIVDLEAEVLRATGAAIAMHVQASDQGSSRDFEFLLQSLRGYHRQEAGGPAATAEAAEAVYRAIHLTARSRRDRPTPGAAGRGS